MRQRFQPESGPTFHLLCLLLLCAIQFAAPLAHAQVVQTEHTEAELISEMTQARPGEQAWVALRLRPDVGWHTYWRNPGDSGLPTRLSWTLPAQVEAGEIHWPYPEVERIGDIVNYGYAQETLHLVPVSIPADWPVGKPLLLKAQAKWLVCADICIPGEAGLSLSMPVSGNAPRADPRWVDAFADARARLPQAVNWPARFDVASDTVSLTVETTALEGAQQLSWFPLPNDLVSHSAPQRVVVNAQAVRITQPRSDYFVKAPEKLQGVLVVTQRGDTRAYTIAASPEVVTAASGARGSLAAIAVPAEGFAGSPSLMLVLLFALLGGLILNLMPCVFPVLSIKAVSLLEAQDETAARKRAHALAYTAGVLVSFLALAGILLMLRGSGNALGWGFQLQQPLFVAALAYLFFAMGLSLSGMVQFGTRLMGVGQSLVQIDSLRGSFFTGVLAVVVASPCTAPFMGVAMGYALVQPVALALLVFLALGLGLALPFLLLGFMPSLARVLPRPGAWMETFKQVMAFPLYLTVVWLLWVLGGLSDRHGMAVALVGLTLVGLALWLWNRSGRVSALIRLVALLAALALLWHPALQPRPGVVVTTQAEWQPWSETRVKELRESGRTIFVNFTADWCVTCLVNERGALRSELVRKAFDENDVVYLKGDWTRPDPAISAALARFGRSGVPLYLVYRGGAEPQVLPQLLTPESVATALGR
jgi:thiol:disulfide interchange protein